MSRYRFIAAERGHYPVRRLCQVLGVESPKAPAWETALWHTSAAGGPA